jgi:hypothetical protein
VIGLSLADAERLLGALDTLDDIFDMVESLHARFNQLEANVATAAEQITALSAKVDDIAADFIALRDAMLAERENLTEAGQAALDAANAKLDALDAEVGDADGSDGEPTPEG